MGGLEAWCLTIVRQERGGALRVSVVTTLVSTCDYCVCLYVGECVALDAVVFVHNTDVCLQTVCVHAHM